MKSAVFLIASFIAALMAAAEIGRAVTPTCSPGYVLSGSQCLPAAPAPACPAGFVFSQGQCLSAPTAAPAPTAQTGSWAFITTKKLGVSSARDLGGASVCVVEGSPGETAVKRYFQTNRMQFSPLSLSAADTTQAYEIRLCDVLTVKSHLAASTLGRLKRPNDHHILPEQFGNSTVATPPVRRPPPAYRPAPAPVAKLFPREIQANLWGMGCLTGDANVVVDGTWGQRSREALRRFYQLARVRYANLEPTQAALNAMNNYTGSAGCASQAAPQPPAHKPRPPVVRKVRCSAIKFAFSSGGTCDCKGNRIFNGRKCVKVSQPAGGLPVCPNAVNGICERQAFNECDGVQPQAKLDQCIAHVTNKCERQNGCRN